MPHVAVKETRVYTAVKRRRHVHAVCQCRLVSWESAARGEGSYFRSDRSQPIALLIDIYTTSEQFAPYTLYPVLSNLLDLISWKTSCRNDRTWTLARCIFYCACSEINNSKEKSLLIGGCSSNQKIVLDWGSRFHRPPSWICFGAYLNHPQRILGDLYHCAKFGSDRRSSFNIWHVWLENAFKFVYNAYKFAPKIC